MKRVRSWIGAAASIMLAACSGGGGSSSSNPPPPPPPPPPTTAQLDATVIDTFGRAVAAAAITTGTTSANTDAAGRARLVVPTGSERVLKIAKDGFAEQFKVVNLAASATAAQLEAMLIAREAAQTIAAIEAGGSATGRDGVKVTFPANALVTASGQAVTGDVQMLMTPVDVADIDVGAFPGVFEGIPAGAQRTPIVSFGTAELVVQQNGQELSLASGKNAEIELPLYVTKLQNGATIVAGDTIPLWSLNESTGVWAQEGSATVFASATSPTGLAVRATIAHFSWWNLDHVAQRGTVSVTVNAPGVTVPTGTAVVIGGTVVAGTGPSSNASTTTTLGTANTLGIPANATTQLEATAQFGDQACRGTANVSPPDGGNVSVTINMTCITLPTPRLVRPTPNSVTNSQQPLGFTIEVDGPQPDTVQLLVDDTSVASFTTQFFYRGFWDSSSFPEGVRQLVPRATRQGISRDGEAVLVTIDRTPPQMVTFTPEEDVEVDRDTVFTVDFDETVTAAPLSLQNFVRLSVEPVGQSTPVNIAIDVELDTAGQQLTVRPTQPLPIGVASLSWSGLHDPAQNPAAGTIAVSWNVSRTQRIGSDIPIEQSSIMAFATDADGIAHVVRRLPAGSDLEVLRFDGADFVPLGPIINERPAVPVSGFVNEGVAIAIRGATVVAFEQVSASNTIEIVVRAFDSASNTWQSLGPPFAVDRNAIGTLSARPQLAIDNLNRPVLAFVGGDLQSVFQAYRFESGAWTSLGVIDSLVFGQVSMSLDANGAPAVLYQRGAFGSNALVLLAAAYNGTTWAPLGAGVDSSPSGSLGRSTIRHADDGQVWVAWNRTGALSVARFNGTAFDLVPLDPPVTSFNGQVGFTFLNGDPVVVGAGSFGAARMDLRRFRNGEWEPQVSIAANDLTRDIRVAASGDTILVAQSSAIPVGRVVRVLFP